MCSGKRAGEEAMTGTLSDIILKDEIGKAVGERMAGMVGEFQRRYRDGTIQELEEYILRRWRQMAKLN